MGRWRSIALELKRVFAIPGNAFMRRTFSSGPRPIDQMFADMMNATGRVSREEALSVPAVLRGRNLICSIATLPLLLRNPRGEVVSHPLFDQIDPDIPNTVTIAQTIEDLLFESISWWRITAFGADGYPVEARHLAYTSVTLQPPNSTGSQAPLPGGYDPRGAVVYVDGKPVPWSEIIRFDSPNPPLCVAGGRAIRRAILLDKAASTYATDPRPLDYFTPAEGADSVDDDEVEAILGKWAALRRKRSTAYVPAALKYNSVDVASPADLQLIEQQKRAGLEIANALGLDPEDLGISTTSRTYQNATDRRQDRINDTLSPYMKAITDRLSMGDVTKRGYLAGFDLDDYLRADPKTRWEVYQIGLNMKAITVDEIRTEEKLPPLPAGAFPKPAPEPAPDPNADATDAANAEAEPTNGATAIGRVTRTFDSTPLTFVRVPVQNFKVDAEKRTIAGRALPYGDVTGDYRRFRFLPGSLEWSETSRVKMFRDHDYSQPLGYATSLVNADGGLDAAFKLVSGADVDRALELATEGVLDGLSVGVDFTDDDMTYDRKANVYDVHRATLREVSLTAMPAFDNARVTKVAASITGGNLMEPDTEPTNAETGAGAPETQTTFAAPQPEPTREPRRIVNPTRATAVTATREALPYRFARPAANGDALFSTNSPHLFSADLLAMARANDTEGQFTDAGKRVMALMRATFDIDSADVNELNPEIQRPDMYVDQREYRRPIWNLIGRGAPPNGTNPFRFPKYSSSSGLVGDHTEGVEPTSGSLVTTSQVVNPTALSGKASITREVWDMGGNPAVSSLIFNQMTRGYWEGLESAGATFLNTLTAAVDINLGVAVTGHGLADNWEAAVADLQFIRGYDLSAFVVEKALYKTFVALKDNDGRPLYPQIGPANANGTSTRRFSSLDLAGVTGIPSWALASTPGSPNNSWLFDPSVIFGWATPPQRLEFPGTDAGGDYAPVAMVDIAIWGYKAFANTDIDGVRQVIYDTV